MLSGNAHWQHSLVLLLLDLRLERWEIVPGEAHAQVEPAQALGASLGVLVPLALGTIPGGLQSRKLRLVRLVLQAGLANYWRARVIRTGARVVWLWVVLLLAGGCLDDFAHLWSLLVEALRWELALLCGLPLALGGDLGLVLANWKETCLVLCCLHLVVANSNPA